MHLERSSAAGMKVTILLLVLLTFSLLPSPGLSPKVEATPNCTLVLGYSQVYEWYIGIKALSLLTGVL